LKSQTIPIDIDDILEMIISLVTTFLETLFVDALGAVVDGFASLLFSREGIFGDKIYILIIVILLAMFLADRRYNH